MIKRTIAHLLVGFAFAFTVLVVFVWRFHMPARHLGADVLTYIVVLVAAIVGMVLDSQARPGK